jgi:hypothetical protein
MGAEILIFLVAAVQDPTTPPSDQAAIFAAAGFKQQGKSWKSGNCDGAESESYAPGAVETYRDLNGDGRADAVVSEHGAVCYGMTGMHFWLLSSQSNGSWKLMTHETAMPEFLETKGVGGWPDLLLGGPGFCFPVLRWNGKAYVNHRTEYDGKPCNP